MTVDILKDLTPLILGIPTLIGGWITSWKMFFKTKTILQQMFLSLDDNTEWDGSVCYNTFNFPNNLQKGAIANCRLHINFSNPDKSVMKVECKWHFIKSKDTKKLLAECIKAQETILVNGEEVVLSRKGFSVAFRDVRWEEYITKSQVESKVILHRTMSFDGTLLLFKGIKISVRLIDSKNRKTNWNSQTLWIYKDSRMKND